MNYKNYRNYVTILAYILMVSVAQVSYGKDLQEISKEIQEYRSAYESGELEQAEILSKLISKQSQLLNQQPGLNAIVLRDIAKILQAKGNFTEAENYYNSAIESLKSVNDYMLKKLLYRDLAELYRLYDRYENVKEQYLKSSELKAEAGKRNIFEITALADDNVRMLSNVHDFFSDYGQEKNDFGRYTYVLVPSDKDLVKKIIEVIIDSDVSRTAESLDFNRQKLNAFYFPVNRDQQKSAQSISNAVPDKISSNNAAVKLTDEYNFKLAYEMLFKFCDAETVNQANLSICLSDFSHGGPYLLTLPMKFNEYLSSSEPALVTDLSKLIPDVYGDVVAYLKQVLIDPESSSEDKLRYSHMHIATLNKILLAANTLSPITEAFAFFIESARAN